MEQLQKTVTIKSEDTRHREEQMNKIMDNYGDIINLPHHESKNRKRMSLYDRAAQFSPFAALTGHSAAIDETSRLIDDRIMIDECRKDEINRVLMMIQANERVHPEVKMTYFVQDERKNGGKYVTIKGYVRRVYFNERENIVEMMDRSKISINDIIDMEIIE